MAAIPPVEFAREPRGGRRVGLVAGAVALALIGGATAVLLFLGHYFPHELTPRRGQARLAQLLDEVYHVPLDPSAEVLAAFAGRPDFPTMDLQSEGSDWYLARLDPARAAAFEARLVAANSASRLPVRPTHLDEILGDHPALRPSDWDGPAWPDRARAWWLDPARHAYAVFFDDRFYLYDSRG